MKKWIMKFFAAVLCFALLTAGCAPSIDPTEDVTTEPTVLDDFTDPTTVPTTNPTESTQSTVQNDPVEMPPEFSHGFTNEDQEVYEGGELHVAFDFSGNGGGIENGVGYLLIVDGMPQPYKISEDGEYSYMHIIYPQFVGRRPTNFEFIFTPVTGQAGDVLEMYAVQIMDPNHRVSQNDIVGGKLIDFSIPVMKTIRMNATPDGLIVPENRERIANVRMGYGDVSAADISGWTAQELRSRSETYYTVNGTKGVATRWGTNLDEPIQLHFEIWGNPDAEFGLVFYVDHRPITIDEKYIKIRNESGKKLCIDFEIDATDLSDEAILYYMIVYRNYTEIKGEGVYWFAETSSTIYLIEADQPIG